VVVAGIILASIIMGSLVILPFVLTSSNEKVLRGGNNYVQVQMQNFEPPPEEILVPPPPPPPEVAHIPEIIKYIPPVVVDTILPTEPKLATSEELMAQPSTAEVVAITGTGAGEDLLSGEGGTGGDEPFFQVEIMPSFKGGDIGKFRDWVFLRTNYPQEAIEKRIYGKVLLTFIVEKDGSVSNVTVINGIDPLLDEEAVRAISSSPKWMPGMQRGQPVRVRFSIPVNFAKLN
jgi:TonB family protein